MGKIIGIDLGTTNSVVAVFEGNRADVIQNHEGMRTTPSVVAFSQDGRLVGNSARRQAVTNPGNTYFSAKRLMGRKLSEVRELSQYHSNEITPSPDGKMAFLKGENRNYAPQEISAYVLQYLKKAAEDYLGESVSDAVVTVPAYFNDSQRQATKEAGTIAGLNVRRIINEPTAAALAYGINKQHTNLRVAVFDLGGGTFDISILEFGGGIFEVLATNGDSSLGGEDYDRILVNHLADEFRHAHGINLREDPIAIQRLAEACERAKCELSSSIQTEILQPFIASGKDGSLSLHSRITRAKFEALTLDLTQKCIQPCINCLKDANITPEQIDEVLLVGGASRMPAIHELVKRVFGKPPRKGINPDEVVAMGAAIQGGIIAGQLNNLLLLDVTPLSLGIETMGGVMSRIIDRNTTIPTRKKERYSTAEDNQETINVRVFQGERKMCKDNRLLANVELKVASAPRGVPQVEVIFDIDANGILSVTATDLDSGTEKHLEIQSSSGLTREDIHQMVEDARSFLEEDNFKKIMADLRNRADTILYESRRLLEKFTSSLTGENVSEIDSQIDKLENALETNDMDLIRRGIADLRVKNRAFSKLVYESQMHSQSDKAKDLFHSSNFSDNLLK